MWSSRTNQSPLKEEQVDSWLFHFTHDRRFSFSQQHCCHQSDCAPSLLLGEKNTSLSHFYLCITSVHLIKMSPSRLPNSSETWIAENPPTAIQSKMKLMLDGSFCSNRTTKNQREPGAWHWKCLHSLILGNKPTATIKTSSLKYSPDEWEVGLCLGRSLGQKWRASAEQRKWLIKNVLGAATKTTRWKGWPQHLFSSLTYPVMVMKHLCALISLDPSQTPYQQWNLSLCSPGHWWRQSRTAPAERCSCPRRGWWWTRRSASSRSRSSPTCTVCWRSSGSTWRCSKPGPCRGDEACVNQRSGEHFTWLNGANKIRLQTVGEGISKGWQTIVSCLLCGYSVARELIHTLGGFNTQSTGRCCWNALQPNPPLTGQKKTSLADNQARWIICRNASPCQLQ